MKVSNYYGVTVSLGLMDLVLVPIQPVYLLVGAFNAFSFKIIIDIYVSIAIFLIVWD